MIYLTPNDRFWKMNAWSRTVTFCLPPLSSMYASRALILGEPLAVCSWLRQREYRKNYRLLRCPGVTLRNLCTVWTSTGSPVVGQREEGEASRRNLRYAFAK